MRHVQGFLAYAGRGALQPSQAICLRRMPVIARNCRKAVRSLLRVHRLSARTALTIFTGPNNGLLGSPPFRESASGGSVRQWRLFCASSGIRFEKDWIAIAMGAFERPTGTRFGPGTSSWRDQGRLLRNHPTGLPQKPGLGPGVSTRPRALSETLKLGHRRLAGLRKSGLSAARGNAGRPFIVIEAKLVFPGARHFGAHSR